MDSTTGILLTPSPPTQLILQPLPTNSSQANGPVRLIPSRSRISQVQYDSVRARGDFIPANPVSFYVNGAPGISVSQAIVEEYGGLHGRDDGISSFEKGKASCRIQFTSYGPYTSKVNTRHNNAGWTPIKRCKLAKEIGKRVKEYIEREGLQGTFALERVYLTRLIQVTQGSWQPELYYEDLVTLNLDS